MFNLSQAMPFITSGLLQVVATLVSGVTTWIAEHRLQNLEKKLSSEQHSADIEIPEDTQYGQFLPLDYGSKRLTALYSWARDLTLIIVSGISVTISFFVSNGEPGAQIKITCFAWWIFIGSFFYIVIKKDYIKYGDMWPRFWIFGPVSLMVIGVNVLLVLAAGYDWIH